MYLKHKPTGNLVEVLDTKALADPCQERIKGRFHAGEELQDKSAFEKCDLSFASGEALPQCWTDPHYKH